MDLAADEEKEPLREPASYEYRCPRGLRNSARAGRPIRAERHNPQPIATLRRQISHHLLHQLDACLFCGDGCAGSGANGCHGYAASGRNAASLIYTRRAGCGGHTCEATKYLETAADSRRRVQLVAAAEEAARSGDAAQPGNSEKGLRFVLGGSQVAFFGPANAPASAVDAPGQRAIPARLATPHLRSRSHRLKTLGRA